MGFRVGLEVVVAGLLLPLPLTPNSYPYPYLLAEQVADDRVDMAHTTPAAQLT